MLGGEPLFHSGAQRTAFRPFAVSSSPTQPPLQKWVLTEQSERYDSERVGEMEDTVANNLILFSNQGVISPN